MEVERNFLYFDELRRYFGIRQSNGGIIPVSRDTIMRHFEKGLRRFKVGGKVAVNLVDLEEYLAGLREKGE